MLFDGHKVPIKLPAQHEAADMWQSAAPEGSMLKVIPHKHIVHSKD